MIQLKINSLKKSSFFLLQSLSDPFQISKEQADQFKKQLAKEEENEGDVSLELMVLMPEKLQIIFTSPEKFDDFSYFLIWTYLINSTSGFSAQNLLNGQILHLLFERKKEVYFGFLNKLFGYFLQKNYKQNQYTLKIENLNINNPLDVWGDSMTEEVEESFAFHLVLRFAGQFAKYFKEWYDVKSKYTKLSGMIIQNAMEDKILLYELDQIELSQHQWKDSQFNIYLNKQNREIQVIYSVDDSKFEYILTIPYEYPKRKIQVKSLNEWYVKDHIMKITLLKLINDKSFSLIAALMEWKKNMDLFYSGLESCTICFQVLEPKTGKSPKEQCYTCKKKFHKECINTWFKNAGKTECPLCKQNFIS